MQNAQLIAAALITLFLTSNSVAEEPPLPESAEITRDKNGAVVDIRIAGKSNLDRLALAREAFDAIAHCSQLESLSLWGTTTSDDDIERLAGLTRLRSLDLSFTKVTGKSFRTLATLKNLVADTTLPVLEAFFAPFVDICERFADRHNLRIEKYYHEFPAWSFLFCHPSGGIGKIDLVRKTESSLGVWRYWWHDDYEAATRSTKSEETEPSSVADANVDDLLESSLATILHWQFGDWDRVHSGYESSWHRHLTKEQFVALDNVYPVLKQ